MKEHEKIATRVFEKYGLKFSTAIKVGGFTNAVWLNGDLALRLSLKRGSDRIRRETSLAKFLPAEIGYPHNFGVGVTGGYEWSVSKRISGISLSKVWKSLSWKTRAKAIKQILNIIKTLHKVEICKVEHLTIKKAWYSSFNVQEAYSCLERYYNKKLFTVKQIQAFYEILECFSSKHNLSSPVLNHGDITMHNLLWSNDKIVSLLDFEHSLIAPLEFDLHSLINLAFLSYNDSEAVGLEYLQYKKSVIELLKPMLKDNYSLDLLLGYALFYRMRFLEFWLESPRGPLEELDAYLKLLSLTKEKRGYLSKFIRGIS